MAHREAHLNLIESSRRLFELDPGVETEATEGWFFGAGRSTHPVISNAAFRIDDDVDPDELIERARDFFAPRKRGFAIWARAGIAEDRELIAAAEAAGLQAVYEMPEMVLDGRPEDRNPPAGVDLRRVASSRDAVAYWEVASSAYASLGFPPEVFAYYDDHEGLWADGVAAFLADAGGQAAAIAMAIVSHGVAGIYWVDCREEARGRSLGRAVTVAAIDAGIDMGATSVSLQASPMGEPLYRRMGFETVFDYRLFMSAPPQEGR